MEITVRLPDDIAHRENPGREALEVLVIEGYSSGVLSARQARKMLGFETRFELDEFLKTHRVEAGSYDVEEYEQDLATIQKMSEELQEKRSA